MELTNKQKEYIDQHIGSMKNKIILIGYFNKRRI